MSELGKAYVQIVPSAKGISGSISSVLNGEATSAGTSAGTSIGSSIGSAIKSALVAVGIGSIIKEALSAGGDLQQSFGGLDTIYGDIAANMKEMSAAAVQAGIDANNYAEQAVSFGAALKQAYGGDMVAAATAADTAILDMADNSAKMGTDIENIQNAYQGFAKQNYTMLDNLKLGYGGTKAEMERLLEDATALSGVEYDIDNLGDVYSAIHVIQEDLGIAGVAAEEASTTFSGSFAAMKAAATNLLANLTLGEDIGPSLAALQTTVSNFLLGNLFPMIGNLLEQIPTLLSGLTDIIVETLSQITDNADAIAQIGVDVISGLIVGIAQAVPLLLEAALSIVTALGEALINTDWSTVGTNVLNGLKSAIDTLSGSIFGVDTSVISSFANGILQAAPNLITTAGSVLNSFLSGILSYATQLLSAGAELVHNLSDGFGGNVADIISSATDVITSLLDTILDSLPELLSAGVKLLGELAIGFIQNLPEIVGAVLDMISSITETIVSHLPDLLQKGIELVGEIAAGIISAIPTIVQSAKDLCDKFKEHFNSIDWAELGKNLIDGIIDGLKNAAGSFYEAIKSIMRNGLNAAKEEGEIHSPSRKWRRELGYQLGAGTTLGFEDGFDTSKIATSLSNGLTIAQSTKVATSDISSNSTVLTPEAIYEAVRQGASDATPAIYLNQREVSRTFSKLGVSLA